MSKPKCEGFLSYDNACYVLLFSLLNAYAHGKYCHKRLLCIIKM